MDFDNLPSSRNMVIDQEDNPDSIANDNASIVSHPEELVKECEDKENEALFSESLDAATQALIDIVSLEDVEEIYNFLPNPDLKDVKEGEAGSGPSTSAYHQTRHTLVNNDTQERTHKWHPTARRIYRQEPTVYSHWESLLAEGHDTNAEYEPFTSQLEWEIVQWVVQEKISQKSFTCLLQIQEVKEHLGISFLNAQSMFQKDQSDEYFTIHHCNPMEAIKGLWGDPAFANNLVHELAKLFQGTKQTEEEWIYSEMWMGGLWNAAQQAILEGGTVAPVIIASDKTQLTQFSGNKAAYPVYLTLSNIPKSLRCKPGTRACILIAYLPVDKPSKEGLLKTEL
ncbi:hypothetical protein GYMLUDRAFT_237209 [Collybiopsis luxurians FD-317 M1]|nr:hypothetical protein GYMLUDRAFT_237209 [Collybiopsis luxurians FD-317 M1]